MSNRISVYVSAPLTTAIDAVGSPYCESRSRRITTIAERYMAMVADELVRTDLTTSEWGAVLDANRGRCGEHYPPIMIWANLADARELGAKWGVDHEATARKLRGLPTATLVAIAEACDRYWSRADLPADAAMRAAGIIAAEDKSTQ